MPGNSWTSLLPLRLEHLALCLKTSLSIVLLVIGPKCVSIFLSLSFTGSKCVKSILLSLSFTEDLLPVTEKHVSNGPAIVKLQNLIPASTVWSLSSNVRSRCKIYVGTLSTFLLT